MTMIQHFIRKKSHSCERPTIYKTPLKKKAKEVVKPIVLEEPVQEDAPKKKTRKKVEDAEPQVEE